MALWENVRVMYSILNSNLYKMNRHDSIWRNSKWGRRPVPSTVACSLNIWSKICPSKPVFSKWTRCAKSGNTYTDHFLIYLLNQNLNQYESNTFQTKEVFYRLMFASIKSWCRISFHFNKTYYSWKNLSTTKYSDFSNF